MSIILENYLKEMQEPEEMSDVELQESLETIEQFDLIIENVIDKFLNENPEILEESTAGSIKMIQQMVNSSTRFITGNLSLVEKKLKTGKGSNIASGKAGEQLIGKHGVTFNFTSKTARGLADWLEKAASTMDGHIKAERFGDAIRYIFKIHGFLANRYFTSSKDTVTYVWKQPKFAWNSLVTNKKLANDTEMQGLAKKYAAFIHDYAKKLNTLADKYDPKKY